MWVSNKWYVETPTFFRQSAHRWRWGCKPYVPAALYPPWRFLVLISVRGWVDSRAIVWLEGLGQLKDPITSSGIEPVTYRLESYCKLNDNSLYNLPVRYLKGNANRDIGQMYSRIDSKIFRLVTILRSKRTSNRVRLLSLPQEEVNSIIKIETIHENHKVLRYYIYYRKPKLTAMGNSLRWPRDTLYQPKLTLTSLTSGGRSVGMVRWRTRPRSFSNYYTHNWAPNWREEPSHISVSCIPSHFEKSVSEGIELLISINDVQGKWIIDNKQCFN
jgi:hypothetical protein